MSHNQWFGDRVAAIQLPADPTALATKKMGVIRDLLGQMVEDFNSVSESSALGLRFRFDEPATLSVESPTLTSTPTVSLLADVWKMPLVEHGEAIKKKTVELVRFWSEGSKIRFEVQHQSSAQPRYLPDSDNPADLVRGAVENFLRAEKTRRG